MAWSGGATPGGVFARGFDQAQEHRLRAQRAAGQLGVGLRAEEIGVHVLGQLLDAQRVTLLAAALAEGEAVAHVHRHPALEVREAEVDPPVAAVGGAEE